MTKYIATKLHQALELAPSDQTLLDLVDLPHYVVDDRLVQMFTREDVTRSVEAIIGAGIARLPYPSLLIEFEAEPTVRRFVRLDEYFGFSFTARIFTLSSPLLTITSDPVKANLSTDPAGIVIDADKASDMEKLSAAFAICVGLLMLNIQGVDKEVIETEKLNRNRERSGKAGIPRHTLLRVGTVYDRNGKPVTSAGAYRMPVHLRAGHVRNQAYGKGRTERKPIYIPPTLVNYQPGDEEPARQPKRILTK